MKTLEDYNGDFDPVSTTSIVHLSSMHASTTASSIADQSSGLTLISYCPAGTLLDSCSISKHVDGHTADESGTRDDIAGPKPEHERR